MFRPWPILFDLLENGVIEPDIPQHSVVQPAQFPPGRVGVFSEQPGVVKVGEQGHQTIAACNRRFRHGPRPRWCGDV